jgi:hypothetical protein
MIVEAKCLVEAYDNQHSRHYFPGFVQDFDTENERLNALVTVGGKWIFQYPGHEGGPAKKVADAVKPVTQPVQAPAPVVTAEKPVDRRKQPMSPERRKQLGERLAKSRAEKRARLEEAVNA